MSPKLIRHLLLIIGIFVGIIVILFLFSSCSNGGSSSKLKTIRTDMVQAAYSYYSKDAHKDELPQDDGTSTSITLKKLVQEGEIGEPSQAYKDETIKCTGEVFVENNNGHFLYTPYVECKSDDKDNNVSSIYLKDKIIEDQKVETGVGLYEMGNTYVERGEVKNNYIMIDEELFRIVRINEDGTIRIFANESIDNIIWDNRYNIEETYNYGINDYISNNIPSRINEKLDKAYNSRFSDKLKALLVTQELCVGKRSVGDSTKDGSTECSNKVKAQIGALSIYEYLQASLDTECVLPNSRNCSNYNWLGDRSYASWLITADADSTYQAYYVDGTVQLTSCNSPDSVFPVFNLSANVLYSEGSGTEEDPYQIRYYPVGEELENLKNKKEEKDSDY